MHSRMRPDEIVRKILEARGITQEDAAREFLSKKPRLAHDPLLLPETEAGADFMVRALSEGKRVCVYGDYDVDGVCGTALLVSFLRAASRVLDPDTDPEVTYYIPSRMGEGYGLNNDAIREIKAAGADVIVTVDCGSVSAPEAAFAREIGLDIIITDHHDPDPGNLPDCIHVNPKAGPEEGAYPFDRLCGAGVAFKLCGAIQARVGDDSLRALLRGCVDLVCVATIADVMPLVDENRTFVKYGLPMLRRGARPGFRALVEVSGAEPAKLGARDVAFAIAPRLNALGRLEDAADGVELFLTEDEGRVWEIAERMDARNSERRHIQEGCFADCMALYEAGAGDEAGAGAGAEIMLGDGDGSGRGRDRGVAFLLLRPEASHEGVAGIVAGKVREATGLPCAVLSETREGKGLLKGSARSAGRLDLIALLRRHGGLFEQLGGHAAAAGFIIREENEGPLREALSLDLAGMLEEEPGLLEERRAAELEIEISDVTPGLAEALEELAPFGVGNPKPMLSLRVPAEGIGGFRRMGQDGKHLRFMAEGLTCVFFNGADTAFPETGMVQIVGCPEINEWGGQRNIQLAVRYIDMI